MPPARIHRDVAGTYPRRAVGVVWMRRAVGIVCTDLYRHCCAPRRVLSFLPVEAMPPARLNPIATARL